MGSSNRAISSKDTTLRKMKAIFISTNLNLLTSPYSISSPRLFPILSPKNLEIFAAPSPACLSTQFSVLKIHKARSLSLSPYFYHISISFVSPSLILFFSHTLMYVDIVNFLISVGWEADEEHESSKDGQSLPEHGKGHGPADAKVKKFEVLLTIPARLSTPILSSSFVAQF